MDLMNSTILPLQLMLEKMAINLQEENWTTSQSFSVKFSKIKEFKKVINL